MWLLAMGTQAPLLIIHPALALPRTKDTPLADRLFSLLSSVLVLLSPRPGVQSEFILL